jgi:hypothetical protein
MVLRLKPFFLFFCRDLLEYPSDSLLIGILALCPGQIAGRCHALSVSKLDILLINISIRYRRRPLYFHHKTVCISAVSFLFLSMSFTFVASAFSVSLDHPVSLSGKIAAVGAPYESGNGVYESGHAYLFDAKSGVLIRTLSSPNPQPNGVFGYSVALSANIVIVGAPTENASGQQYAGHSYVFNATTGALIKILTSPNAQSHGVFGRSLAISGNTVVVGAYGETANGQPDAGHAYMFVATTGKLIKTLTSPNPQTYQEFGFSVAVSSKIVAVGAPSAGGGVGPADTFLFNAATGALISTLGNSHSGGEFGYAVAAKGNLEIVGASHENVGGKKAAGQAYIF